MKEPRVTVQIVTYNNEKTIIDCIRSVQRQRNVSINLLVIDSGSSDGTVALMKAHDIRVIVLGKNVGYGAAHNIGFNQTKSEYVLTLNPDILLKPDFLSAMVSAMDQAGSAAGSGQGMLFRVGMLGKSSRTIDSAGLYMTPYRRQGLRYEQKEVSSVPTSIQEIFGPDGAAAFYRRSMLNDINLGFGIFDESYFMHKEDVDLIWRAQLRGWKSIFVPTAQAYHIRTFRAGHRAHIPPRLRMIAARNRYFLIAKNDDLALFVLALPWILLYEAAIITYMAVYERESLQAYTLFLQQLPSLLRKRKVIQKKRKASTIHMSRWFSWKRL